jgi:hypothetical protein
MRPPGKATRSPNIGNIRATSNAARRDAASAECSQGFHHGLLDPMDCPRRADHGGSAGELRNGTDHFQGTDERNGTSEDDSDEAGSDWLLS